MSENLQLCVSFTFTWHTLGPNPCKKCMALNGRTWTDQTIWQPQLIDEVYGAIWDFTVDMSLAHGGLGRNCHCFLEITVEVDPTKLESYREFQTTMEELTSAK